MPIGTPSGSLRALRQLVEDQRGVVAAVTAMLVVPLVIGVGVAVDASRMFLVRARLAQAVDAAALAAGQAVDVDEVIADAQRIFDVNYPSDYMGAAVDNLDVRFDEESGEVEIVARTAVPTLVMSLAQIDALDIEARRSWSASRPASSWPWSSIRRDRCAIRAPSAMRSSAPPRTSSTSSTARTTRARTSMSGSSRSRHG